MKLFLSGLAIVAGVIFLMNPQWIPTESWDAFLYGLAVGILLSIGPHRPDT